jgi:hypothetical protein
MIQSQLPDDRGFEIVEKMMKRQELLCSMVRRYVNLCDENKKDAFEHLL